jgi:hypothetical protein
MAKNAGEDDLLTPEEAADALKHHVSAQMIRKRVREGDLPCYWQQATPGKIFVKRRELLKLYDEKINGWKDMRRSA